MDTFIQYSQFRDRESKRIQLWACYAGGKVFQITFAGLPTGLSKTVTLEGIKKAEV